MANDELPGIDPELLAAVTGGTADSGQIELMLQTLMSSIKDLAQHRNSGGNNSFMQMLPMLLMMKNRQTPRSAAVVETPPPGDGWIKVT